MPNAASLRIINIQTETLPKIRVWDVMTGKQLECFEGHKERVRCAAFLDEEGNRVVSASDDGTVRVWEAQIKAGREVARHRTFGWFWSVCPSRNGRFALTDYDENVSWWNLEKREETKRLVVLGHKKEDWIRCVALSSDEKYALSGGVDCCIRLWDLTTGQQLAQADLHEKLVRCVAFSPTSEYALSSSEDGTVRLWRLPESVRAKK